MRIAVIGAGVVGLATAHALHRDGHAVTVVERLDAPGAATSRANAGGLCPSFAGPWAAPGMVGKALRWLALPTAPLKIRPRPDPRQWGWLLRFALECDAGRSAANKRAMQAIAHYSLDCLHDVIADTGVTFDHAQGGVLQTFRSADTLAAGQRAARVLESLGIEHRLVPPEGIAQIEPALARSALRFTGALHLPRDETGDAHAFCTGLAAWLAARGVDFRLGTPVTGFDRANGRLTGLLTPGGRLDADACVVAAGPFARGLPTGLRLPVYPVKGYSLTWQAVAADGAPRSSIMDEDSKTMLTRLGTRLRAGGVAELDGFNPALRPAPLVAMQALAEAMFPAVAGAAPPAPWAGFRPMTPDGCPRMGESPALRGLWVSVGHGSNGWTQAAGAARFLADLIAGRRPAIDPAPYAPDR